MAKSKTSPLSFEPDWDLPDDERLQENDVASWKRFYVNDGLRSILIEAARIVDPPEGQNTGVFQRIKCALDPEGKPLVSAERLAQVVFCRSEEFALTVDRKTEFRILITGQHANGKDWKVRHRFWIDPSEYEEEDKPSQEASDDEEEEEEQVEEEETKPVQQSNPKPNGTPRPAPPRVESAQTQLSPAQQGQAHVDKYSQPVPDLPNLFDVDPASKAALAQGLQPQTVAYQVDPRFIIALHEHGQQTTLRLVGPLFDKVEKCLEMVTKSCSAMLEDQRKTMKAVCDDAIEQRKMANEDARDLRAQIVEMTKYNNAHYENLQRLAAQGWQAFIDGMQMKGEVYAERSAYERIISGQAIETARHESALEAAANSGPGTIASIMEASPAILALASAALKGKSPGTADFLEKIAMVIATAKAKAAEDQRAEQQEEEEDEEEVVDASYEEKPNGRAPDEPRPTVDRARALRMSLSDEQVAALQKVMPPLAWQAFEVAVSTESEHEAIGALAKLGPLVHADAAVQVGIMGALRPEQIPMLMDLVDGVKAKAGPRRAPPRPRASAAAPAAE